MIDEGWVRSERAGPVRMAPTCTVTHDKVVVHRSYALVFEFQPKRGGKGRHRSSIIEKIAPETGKKQLIQLQKHPR